MSDLVERLRKVESSSPQSFWDTTNWYRNPDGPEAADAIEQITAERDRLEQRARFFMGMLDVREVQLAEALAEIQNLGKRESDYKELYQVERAYLAEANQISDDFRNENATLQADLAEARGLLAKVAEYRGEVWYDLGKATTEAIDAFLSRTEGKRVPE